jgi:RNA polymerase sigma-70 factor (ECF subfamily)
VVDAFLAAARGGDIEALVRVLDPDVVVRADGGPLGLTSVTRGARTVASNAIAFARLASNARPAVVNGAAGVIAWSGDTVVSVGAFTVAGGRIVEIDFLTDPERLARLDLNGLR